MAEETRKDDALLPHGGRWTGAAMLLWCAGWVALALYLHQPPSPRDAGAPETAFSADRAWQHLLHVAKEPHPAGSAENAKVRDYLAETVRSMGYEPEVQPYLHPVRTDRPPYQLSYVENVLVRVRGTGGGRAFVLMAHYDSVPYGPGASDDGSGVVTMLETLRALKHHPPLANDVVFLFTDGEEAGLLGARGFLAHPWYEDTALIMNYEARGHYGPGYMFETSPENGWLIRQLQMAAAKPIANSIMFDVAGRMPTTTDYRVLKREGMPGLNFAFVGGIKYYHTPNDSPQKISRATLQHQGDNALSMTLHLGNADLSEVRGPDVTYFNTLGGHLVVYPNTWVWPIALAALGATAFAVVLGRRRGRLGFWRTLAGAAAFLACIAAAAAVVAVLTLLAWLRFNEYIVYNSDLFFAGYTALTVCIVSLLHQLFRRWLNVWELAAGAMLCWAAALAALTAALPGASFVLAWPLLAAALAMAALFALGPHGAPAWRWAVLAAWAVVPLALLGPWIYVCSVAVTIVPAPAWMAMAVLVLGLLAPQLAVMARPNPLWLPGLASGMAAPLLGLAFFWFAFTPDYPKMNHLCYGMNCSTGEAWWMSNDAELDEYTRALFQDDRRGKVDEFRPGDPRSYRKAPAPAAAFAQPELDIEGDYTVAGYRHLRFAVRSPRAAARMSVTLGAGAVVYSAHLEGQRLGSGEGPQNAPDKPWSAAYQGLPGDGLQFDLVVGEGPLTITVREESFGLPPVPGIAVPPRPPYMITQNNVKRWWEGFKSNVVYSVKEFRV